MHVRTIFLLSGILALAFSCNMQTNSGKQHPGPADDKNNDKNKVYKLHLNPSTGSAYYYNISNESKIKLEANDKQINNISKSNVSLYYDINKDSSGNFLFTIRYDKIHLYSKNGDSESEMDAANAATSIDAVERMLGALKSANIVATISSAGEVKSITGYKEIAAKLMAGFNANDTYGKSMAQSKWDQLIEKGLIKKNMTQLFKIFPDSAVHVGDKWKLNSKETNELNLNASSTYTLKSITDGIALIESDSELASDGTSGNLMMGYDVTSNLEGEQQGEYQMEIKTGMLMNSSITAQVKGTIQMVGREMPITINSKVKMDGHKIK